MKKYVYIFVLQLISYSSNQIFLAFYSEVRRKSFIENNIERLKQL